MLTGMLLTSLSFSQPCKQVCMPSSHCALRILLRFTAPCPHHMASPGICQLCNVSVNCTALLVLT